MPHEQKVTQGEYRDNSQKLEGWSCNPRDAKAEWLPPEARRGKEGFYPVSQRIMALLRLWFLISSLQNWKGINFCYVKPPDCAPLLWQLWEANTDGIVQCGLFLITYSFFPQEECYINIIIHCHVTFSTFYGNKYTSLLHWSCAWPLLWPAEVKLATPEQKI